MMEKFIVAKQLLSNCIVCGEIFVLCIRYNTAQQREIGQMEIHCSGEINVYRKLNPIRQLMEKVLSADGETLMRESKTAPFSLYYATRSGAF